MTAGQPPPGYLVDEDALYAGVDLVARSGANNLEFGHLDDTPDVADARWWATATFQGAKLMEDNHRGPVEAVEALARRILAGGRCAWCTLPVTLAGDGTDPDTCRWRRVGAHWDRGCIDTADQRRLARDGTPLTAPADTTPNPRNRQERRRHQRALAKKRNPREGGGTAGGRR